MLNGSPEFRDLQRNRTGLVNSAGSSKTQHVKIEAIHHSFAAYIIVLALPFCFCSTTYIPLEFVHELVRCD